jgi:hypothetical protein
MKPLYQVYGKSSTLLSKSENTIQQIVSDEFKIELVSLFKAREY